jgi:hypothetical protein
LGAEAPDDLTDTRSRGSHTAGSGIHRGGA